MRKKIISVISILVVIICSCYLINGGAKHIANNVITYISSKADRSKYIITNVNIYRDTPAWDLAIAVRDEDTNAIEKIVKDKPELLNYQDPKYGATLLLWSVGMEKYESAEAL